MTLFLQQQLYCISTNITQVELDKIVETEWQAQKSTKKYVHFYDAELERVLISSEYQETSKSYNG